MLWGGRDLKSNQADRRMGPKSAYLCVYNVAACLGWAYVLYLTVANLLNGGSCKQLWQVAERPLIAAQSMAVLEVVHSALGLVRSPVVTTGMQVLSRMWVLWGIILAVPKETIDGAVRLGPLPLELNLKSLLLAWGITEVIRYSFYALKELSIMPYPLLWLRYTTFVVLYPFGVASELAMVYLALPTIRESKMWSATMPNSLNIGFDYHLACWAMLAGYIPGFPQLYLYMISQRQKMLGSKSKQS